MKKDFSKIIANHHPCVEKIMEEAGFHIFKNEANKAIEIIETLVNTIDDSIKELIEKL
jgi:hypothetical protein